MARRRQPAPEPRGRLPWRWLVIGGLMAALVVPVIAIALATAGPGDVGSTEAGRGGSWTNVSADQLAGMLGDADLTVVNVKTPYIGEIAGTDLVIPYTALAARAAELPASRAARILVYCRSGAESRVAAQTLLDLGYTHVLNLDGGMAGWSASGRSIVQASGR